MDQVSGNSNFQIILKPGNEEDLSDYWQDQCRYLYDEISMSLPEGSIKPLILESKEGEKSILAYSFANLILNIPIEIFFSVVFHEIIDWFYKRQYATIEMRCPDGQVTQITKNNLPKMITYLGRKYHLRDQKD